MRALQQLAQLVAQDAQEHAGLALVAARGGSEAAARTHARLAVSGLLAACRPGYLTLVATPKGFGCAHAHATLSEALAETQEARSKGLRALVLVHREPLGEGLPN